MAATTDPPASTSSSVPRLRFVVQDAQPVDHAAVPMLKFALAIDADDQPIRSILLDVQLQIAARRRGYGEREQELLREVFGSPERWGSTLRTLPWIRTTLVVPPFLGSTVAELAVTCTYDLEVIASRYLAALGDGAVPLEFLFSGSVFFSGAGGALQTARIPWDSEFDYAMPAAVWRQAIERHFPGAAWIRCGRETFERLCRYKARHSFATWEDTIEALLAGEEHDDA